MREVQLFPDLGWIPGDVIHLGRQIEEQELPALKIPHMGWNHLQLHKPDHPVLAQMHSQMQFYFVHSYIFKVASPHIVWLQHHMG